MARGSAASAAASRAAASPAPRRSEWNGATERDARLASAGSSSAPSGWPRRAHSPASRSRDASRSPYAARPPASRSRTSPRGQAPARPATARRASPPGRTARNAAAASAAARTASAKVRRCIEASQTLLGALSHSAPAGREAPVPGALRPAADVGASTRRAGRSGARLGRLAAVADLEHREESVLGHLDAPDLLHALLALFLALEQLALAADVAAIALGRDVLAVGLDGLAGDDVRADRRLDRDVVLLARDALAQLLDQRAPDLVGLVAVHDHRQRVDRIAGQEDVELDHVRGLHPDDLVVERGVAPRARLELVEEVEDDLGERQ